MRLTITATVTADLTRRTLTGTVYRYGETGYTSAGPLAVGATMPPPPVGLPMSWEHDRDIVRGHIALVDNNGERLRIAVRVIDGPEGDAALAEASDRTRAAFSFDIEDAEVIDGVIVSGRWEAVGQVANPAFNSARIDQIAAAAPHHQEGTPMLTDEQRARLEDLIAQDSLTADEQEELRGLLAILQTALSVQEGAPTEEQAAAASAQAAAAALLAALAGHTGETEQVRQVAASRPAVPTGVQAPPRAVVRESGTDAIRRVFAEMTDAFRGRQADRLARVSAALEDIVHTDHTDHISAPQFAGELWSGRTDYRPKWTDLFSSDSLTHWRGTGWRFVETPEMQDYVGDKAAIPTGGAETEDAEWEAARAAVGVDIDRKFFDFPSDNGFLEGLFRRIGMSWDKILDTKVRAYTLANLRPVTKAITAATTTGDATVTGPAGTFKASDVGATITGPGVPVGTTVQAVTNSGSIEMSANATATAASVTLSLGVREPSILKAAARAVHDLDRREVGTADWVMLNDEDLFSLLDLNEDAVPAFLNLYKIDPAQFRSDSSVPRGSVLAGVRQSATVRTLPGSPIKVDAQHLANGGVDKAFFGYWAIQQHHTSGIAVATYNPVG